MQAENPELQRLLDQRHRSFGKVLPVSHECEHHAHRQLSREHELRSKKHDQDQFDPEDEIIDRAERDLGAAKTNIGIRDLCIAIEPLPFAFAFAIEQLQTLDGADGLDEGRVLMRAGLNRRLRASPQDAVKRKPDGRVQAASAHTTINASVGLYTKIITSVSRAMIPSIRAVIMPSAKKIADRLQRGESGQHVADMPLFKEGRRQPDQVTKQPCAQMEVNDVLHHQQNQRSHCARRHAHQHQDAETQRQYDEKIDIASCDDLVDGQLHIERPGENQNLQHRRKDEDLHQRVGAAAQLTPEHRERQPRAFILPAGNLASATVRARHR